MRKTTSGTNNAERLDTASIGWSNGQLSRDHVYHHHRSSGVATHAMSGRHEEQNGSSAARAGAGTGAGAVAGASAGPVAGRNKVSMLSPTPPLALLALGALGGQCVWSTEMAFASPYLLHLGMSKSHMAIVFVAGPLSGLIVQPCIGLISDSSRHKWGRRRPILVLACLMCTFSLLLLGFARAIAGTMIGSSHARDTVTIALVVLSIFAIDFSVNAVNALDRALLLDLVPIHQQSTANAWAARMSGIGAIFGFLIGQTDLTQLVPFRWFSVLQPDLVAGIDSTEAQIRCVSLLVSFLLVTTHLVTVAVAKETPLSKVETIEDVEQAKRSMLRRLVLYFVSMMRDLALAARQLPRPMLEIFRVQFFLSLGWYPTLFYSTTWVSQIVARGSTTTDEGTAVRKGSLAMLYHAIVSLVCTLLLPSALALYKRVVLRRAADSLTLLWAFSMCVLASALLGTLFASNEALATLVVAITGFPLALTMWAPFTLLGIIIRKQAAGLEGEAFTLSDRRAPGRHQTSHADERPLMRRNSHEDDGHGERNTEQGVGGEGRRQEEDPTLEDGVLVGDIALEAEGGSGGTIVGLHNISLVSAHFLMTAFSTIVFAMMEPSAAVESASKLASQSARSPPSESDAIGFVLRTGGLASIVASYFAFRLAHKHKVLLDG